MTLNMIYLDVNSCNLKRNVFYCFKLKQRRDVNYDQLTYSTLESRYVFNNFLPNGYVLLSVFLSGGVEPKAFTELHPSLPPGFFFFPETDAHLVPKARPDCFTLPEYWEKRLASPSPQICASRRQMY